MTIMCCVRENPKPIRFNVARYGVRQPEISLDRKQLHSEKVSLVKSLLEELHKVG